MRGGRAFTKPLPFPLGGFVQGMTDTANKIACLQACGMSMCRLQASWNNFGYDAGFEMTVGSYSSTAAALTATAVAAYRTANISPLIVVTSGASPQLCPILGTALVSGNNYTSVNVGSSNYPTTNAITSGDSLVLTDPTNLAHTQTIIAAAKMPAGSYGALAVTSFTANNNYPLKSWVYDTAWVPCTPKHLADAMAWLVAQTGLQGLRWEILNEPDGAVWPGAHIDPTQYVQMMKLVYAAMKAADPTCIIHGFVVESLSPIGLGFGDGLTWMTPCYAAGMAQGVTHDAVSVHVYPTNGGAPLAIDPYYGMTQPQLLGNFRAFMIANGDTSPVWFTEWGWTYPTQQSQAQYMQDALTAFCGMDTINGVLFSSYLKGILEYAVTGAGYNYGLFGSSGTPSTPNLAVAILAELVSGH